MTSSYIYSIGHISSHIHSATSNNRGALLILIVLTSITYTHSSSQYSGQVMGWKTNKLRLNFSLHFHVQADSGAHSASHPKAPTASISGVK